MSVAGVVLCGGASTRLGRHKALVEIHGVPAARRLLVSMRRAGLHPVVAATSLRGTPADSLLAMGFDDVVLDCSVQEGPLCGVVAALERTHRSIVVWAVDTPCVPPLLLEKLANHSAQHVVLDVGPLGIKIGTSAIEPALTLLRSGRTGVRALLRQLPTVRMGQGALWTVDPNGWRHRSFNTLDEWSALERALLSSERCIAAEM